MQGIFSCNVYKSIIVPIEHVYEQYRTIVGIFIIFSSEREREGGEQEEA